MRQLFVSLILIMLLVHLPTGNEIQTNFEPQDKGYTTAQIITPPIIILCNENFSSLGFPGTGTSGNPYRIEDLSFKLESPYLYRTAIFIVNTTAHFVIQNCDIRGYTESEEPIYPDAGVTLGNVTNGVIRRNRFSESMYGIAISWCENILIEWNNFTGIETEWMQYDVMGRGVCTGGSLENRGQCIDIRNNNFMSCSQGVMIQGTLNFNVSLNSFIGCGTGIVIEHLAYGTVQANSCVNGSVAGIQCIRSVGTKIINNTFSHNREYGVLLDEESRENVLQYNLIAYNGNQSSGTGLGIWVHNLSPGNNITMNDLIGNVENVINDNGGTEYDLNYYSDYTGIDEDGDGIGEDPYPIPGDDETSDLHPRVLRITQYLELIQTHTDTTTTEEDGIPQPLFTMLVGVSVLVILVFLVAISKRNAKQVVP